MHKKTFMIAAAPFLLAIMFASFTGSCSTPGHPVRPGQVIQELGAFSGGRAPVRIADLWGFISTDGQIVIEPQFSDTKGFHSGYAAVRLKERWGLIKPSGKYVILPKYADMGDFSENLIPVKNEKGWGFADVSGKLTVAADFDEVRSFHNGKAAVKEGSRWGFIDLKNHFVINPTYAHTGDFLGKYAPVGTQLTDNGWGYVDSAGQEVIKPQFDNAQAFSEGIAAVLVDDYWGFISETGNLVINPVYDDTHGFSHGLAPVKFHGKWGFINPSGEMVLPPTYDSASDFDESELSLVQVAGRRFFIGRDGKTPPRIAGIKTAGTHTGPFELERITPSIGAEMATLHASKSGISVSFPADMIPAGVAKDTSLVVYDRQFGEYSSNKFFAANPQGVKLSINTASILPDRRIRISIPYSGHYDPETTYLLVEDQGIYPFVLDSSLSDGVLTGDLDSGWLLFLASRGITDANLNIVVMDKKPNQQNDDAFTASIQLWDPKAKKFTPLPSNLDLAGKSVALVVHGLASKVADMANLAGALAPAKNHDGKAAYDLVLGYNYGMGADIPTQGSTMAAQYLAIKGAETGLRLDIFAHSMGNLVSRWAMQRPDKTGQAGLDASRIGQYVRNYVSLGGPHEGVPFKNGVILKTITFLLEKTGGYFWPCLNDLMCQGTPKGSAPESLPWVPSETIGLLNYCSNPDARGPDFKRDDFKITTLTGNVWDTYELYGLPYAFITGYWQAFTTAQFKDLYEDGIVATYSAHGNELRKISSSVENIPELKMNHGQLYNDSTALKAIQTLVARSGW